MAISAKSGSGGRFASICPPSTPPTKAKSLPRPGPCAGSGNTLKTIVDDRIRLYIRLAYGQEAKRADGSNPVPSFARARQAARSEGGADATRTARPEREP